MTTRKTTPSEPTGTKLTKEVYDEAQKIWEEEGGSIITILETRFGIKDVNPYQHYYGFNKPID